MRRPQPRWPRQAGNEAVEHGRWARHPARPGPAPANRHDSPLLSPTLDKLDDIGPLPDDITVHLDAGYDSQKTRDELAARGLTGEIAHKGDKAPIQAGQWWHVERTSAWHNNFNKLQRCYERREDVIDAFFDLADTIITVRSLIRQSWTLYRWDGRPAKRPWSSAYPRGLLSSSPWIRWYPQPWFSVASRSISAAISVLTGGRPVRFG
jgi:hypothetical protein